MLVPVSRNKEHYFAKYETRFAWNSQEFFTKATRVSTLSLYGMVVFNKFIRIVGWWTNTPSRKRFLTPCKYNVGDWQGVNCYADTLWKKSEKYTGKWYSNFSASDLFSCQILKASFWYWQIDNNNASEFWIKCKSIHKISYIFAQRECVKHSPAQRNVAFNLNSKLVDYLLTSKIESLINKT